jgi:hypothetical protein
LSIGGNRNSLDKNRNSLDKGNRSSIGGNRKSLDKGNRSSIGGNRKSLDKGNRSSIGGGKNRVGRTVKASTWADEFGGSGKCPMCKVPRTFLPRASPSRTPRHVCLPVWPATDSVHGQRVPGGGGRWRRRRREDRARSAPRADPKTTSTASITN